MEMLHEVILRIATHPDELFQMMNSRDRRVPQGKAVTTRSPPLNDEEGRFIFYTCNEAGHMNMCCPQQKENVSDTPTTLIR